MTPVPGSSASPEREGVDVAPTAPTHPGFWDRVVRAGAANKRMRILLDGAALVEAGDADALLRVSRSVFSVAASSVKEIEALMAQVAGRAISVRLKPDVPAPPAAPAVPRTPAGEHPLVKTAIELFGARIVSVRPRPQGEPPA